jgi:hypothetical protein
MREPRNRLKVLSIELRLAEPEKTSFSRPMARASTAKQTTTPPSLETILRRADEVKTGAVKGRSRRELSQLWAKHRKKASARA